MIVAREAFLKAARLELNATHCLTLSPFVAALNYDDLMERLRLFSDDIKTSFATVKHGLKIHYMEDQPEQLKDLKSVSLITATDRAFQTKYGNNIEQSLMKVFLEDVGKVQKKLFELEELVRTNAVTEKDKQEIFWNFWALENLVEAIPAFYEQTPDEMQEADNFVFRTPARELAA